MKINAPFSAAFRELWRRNGRLARCLALLIVVAGLAVGSSLATPPTPVRASTLPSGFVESQVAGGLKNPTSIAFAPDGRIFVTEKAGSVWVVKNGVLLATPFVTVPVATSVDLGLMGFAFDPNFATNQFIYIYYTASTPTVHNRLSRFTANGDVAAADSEMALMDFATLGPNSTMNVGGTIRFDSAGQLYLSTGDVEVPANSQTMGNLFGKILRLNTDGSIPTDNPFYNTASGNNRAIWALGFRNPFKFDIQPGTDRFFANDVGQDGWEEIDGVAAGGNYGWPTYEGLSNNLAYKDPLFMYAHGWGPDVGCAITGGAFYNPPINQFPGQYVGNYFFTDYCGGWIKVLDLANGNVVSTFATGLNFPVDLQIGPDGSMYYLLRNTGSADGQLFKVQYIASQPPSIDQQPSNMLASEGYSATFTMIASGTTPLNYQWQKNGTDIPDATSSTYSTPPTILSDDGSVFKCVVTNAFGTVTSNDATLTITTNKPPVGTITMPADGTLYSGGDVINYAGTGTDTEDGTLPASAFTWQIDMHHNTHTHSFMPATSGYQSGSFTIPTSGHTATNVWYRIYLTVTDSVGLTHTSYVDIHPRTTTITVQTDPPGLQLSLDDQPGGSPETSGSVINVLRKISVPTLQRANGKIWIFDHWSDGGAATHTINTPATDTTYTAYYHDLGPFVEQNGQVVIETEDYDDTTSRGSQAWIFRNGLTGFAGTGYMRADPDNNVSNLASGYSSLSPELRYSVRFTTLGTYYVWLRLNAPAPSGDTLHVGLDGAEIPSASNVRDNTLTAGSFIWTNTTVPGPVATLNISTPGVHTINIWMGEDGLRIDRLLLTTSSTFVPTGNGPTESVRGDGSVVYPTPTPLPPTPTATPLANPLKLQYRTSDTITNDNGIKPGFKIVNQTGSPVPMSELKIRYYFTRDSSQSLMFSCDYAIFGCANVTSSFTPISAAGADYYMEVGFTAGAGNIPANSTTVGLSTRINKSDWSVFNETNDYSFDVTKTTYADWNKVTLYRNGVLIWGVEPQNITITSTPIPPTPTITPTPGAPTPTSVMPTPTLSGSSFKVQYKTGDTITNDNGIKPGLRIVNMTGTAVPLSDFTIRYYFTRDTNQSLMFSCDYAIFGCTNLTSSFVPISAIGADFYMEVGFKAGAGSVPANSITVGISTRVNKSDWSAFDETNDYSFDVTKTTYADWNKITLYRNGDLVWGIEPPSTTPTATMTPVPPTPTPTLPANPLKVQYKTGDTITNDNGIKAGLKIVNQTNASVPMSELKIRYYFTRDSNQPLLFSCDYAYFGCTNVTSSFVAINAVGADYYMEVGFTAGAGSIAANSASVGLATRINKSDWSAFDETNDYSFDVTKTAYADWTKITLYRNGVLIWGTEPPAAPGSAPTFVPASPTP